MNEYKSILVNKAEADIMVGIITREIAEIANIKADLEERGITLSSCGLNVRQIELRHLLELFSNASE